MGREHSGQGSVLTPHPCLIPARLNFQRYNLSVTCKAWHSSTSSLSSSPPPFPLT